MAYDQLKLYNEALLLIGQRSLASLSENREPRFRLDEVFANEAVEYCLEQAQPAFARKTSNLTSPSAGSTMDFSHALPSDYVAFIGVFTDAGLSQPVGRYVIEGNTIVCDSNDIYLRFISNDDVATYAEWDTSFSKFVASYLAREIATRLTKDEYAKLEDKYNERLIKAAQIASNSELDPLPSDDSSTISNDWLTIYNDALLILGLEDIIKVDDQSNRRFKLSQALNAGIVEDTLEDIGWQFAQVLERLDYNPSIDPEFGYRRAFNKPDKLHRIEGIFTDEYLRRPLKLYQDEGDYFFSDYDDMYLLYVSTDFLSNPAGWPTFFKRLIAGRMAKDAANSLKKEGADVDNAKAVYKERFDNAASNDAMQSPPRILSEGSWVGNRNRGTTQGRP